MTGHLTPPRADQQIGRTKRRVHDLERRLARAQEQPIPYVARFSWWGPVELSLSGADSHPLGGRLLLMWAHLIEPGTVEIDLLHDGVVFDTLNIVDTNYGEQVVSEDFAARRGRLQVEVVSFSGTPDTLTVFGLFDR